MKKKIISTNAAPKAVGPYSQAIEANGFIFCSGQVAINPKSGQKLNDKSIEEQTHQVMRNLQAVLRSASADFANVVKSTIFVTDLANYLTINDIYGSYFDANPPARSTIQVAALPLNMSVEIEMIAILSK